MSAVQHPHYTPSPKTKPYETRHRLTWAARYPLLPGLDIMSRRGLLVLIAECSLSGSYYESQERLSERAGISVSGVQKLLAKLCAEGALRAHRRGFKKTTRYTLESLAEVSEHGDFLPVDRNHSSSQTPFDPPHSTPQTTHPPPFDPPHSTGRNAFDPPHSTYKAVIRHAVNPLNPPLKQEPKNEPGTISPTAHRLNEYLIQKTMRPLPAPWMFYRDLQERVEPLNFARLASTLAATVERMGGYLPDPEDFFASYDETAAESTSKRKRKTKSKRRAA